MFKYSIFDFPSCFSYILFSTSARSKVDYICSTAIRMSYFDKFVLSLYYVFLWRHSQICNIYRYWPHTYRSLWSVANSFYQFFRATYLAILCPLGYTLVYRQIVDPVIQVLIKSDRTSVPSNV
ncbi:hypothetical protein XELAEV_18027516mg [Xenopus laevis]|uniref:Uncharacterized protein n=1 Tax=Xenopus laevis TaxID=8355 RepID=A0A974HJQ4_XENLA|nr:hypothetical protein XELAEV_18027516mg [Xenopus laevis]